MLLLFYCYLLLFLSLFIVVVIVILFSSLKPYINLATSLQGCIGFHTLIILPIKEKVVSLLYVMADLVLLCECIYLFLSVL